MKIDSIDIKYSYYGGFSMNSNDGMVHIKSLPYLSIVQSKVGSYGIKLDDGNEYPTGQGNFFIAPSMVTQTITHFLNKEINTFTARYIFLDVIVNKKYHLDDILDLPVVIDENSNRTFDKLFDEYESAETVCDKMISLYGIIKHLISISSEKPVFRNEEIYPLIEFIAANYTRDISVCEMAGILKISESNLYAVFKKNTGVSPVKYLNNYRLSVASNLLTETDDSIKNIAEKVGIGDQFYFSKLFKAKYNKSPQEYRKKCPSVN